MVLRVLHILSQRPGRTGSGVTLEAMVRHAAAAGWEQAAVVGVPADDAVPPVGGLDPAAVRTVRFAAPGGGAADLDFPIPGMSDVMPYPSTVWSAMTASQLDRYRTVWRERLATVIAEFAPDLIHTHHIWLMSSLLKDLAPAVPVVATCHSTGLRQLALTPHLADEVRHGCARIDHFCVLHAEHADALRLSLGLEPGRVTVVGAGYRPELFSRIGRTSTGSDELLYVGKYSHAKGLPWLLDAFETLRRDRPGLRLHVAGEGAGPEADALRRRMTGLAPAVVLHGQLDQPGLAALMRRCGVCVLPSFYEGVPLVLVEAAACGCRLVATRLPGVVAEIAPRLGPWLELVPLPRLNGPDAPVAADLPAFVEALTAALRQAVDLTAVQAAAGGSAGPDDLAPFTWGAVFARIEAIWLGQTS